MKPVPHLSVANIRISEQTTKFYLSFFTLFLPNATSTSPTPLSSRATPGDLIIHQTSHIISVNPPGILNWHQLIPDKLQKISTDR